MNLDKYLRLGTDKERKEAFPKLKFSVQREILIERIENIFTDAGMRNPKWQMKTLNTLRKRIKQNKEVLQDGTTS